MVVIMMMITKVMSVTINTMTARMMIMTTTMRMMFILKALVSLLVSHLAQVQRCRVGQLR